MIYGKLAAPRSIRKGRTASWPASLLPVRFRGQPTGLYLRMGNRAWYLARTPRRRGV